MNDDPDPSAPTEEPGELAALLREIRDRLPPPHPASRWQRLQDAVRTAEPWGILLAVIALGFTLWAFQVEQIAREEDRINRAIGQFAEGVGRIDALAVLLRNNVDLSLLEAPDAYLPYAPLSEAYLDRANFSGAQLNSVNFRGAYLDDADLSGASLFGANLTEANLHRANLSGAFLYGATLGGANLSGADLSGTDLRATILHGANLSGADLSGADLGADLNLSDARLCQTTMPDHSQCDRDCDPSGACPWAAADAPRAGAAPPSR